MLTKSFLYNINKNPKDLQGNTFQLGVIVHSWYPLSCSSREVEEWTNYCQIRRVQTQDLEGISALWATAARTNYTVFQQKKAVWIKCTSLLSKRPQAFTCP